MPNTLYFVDVGTHVGQEYRALRQMRRSEYWRAYIRHRVRVFRKGGDRLSYASFDKMLKDNSHLRSAPDRIRCVLVEPNRNLFSTVAVFRQAEYAYNVALSSSSQPFCFTPLYYAKGDRMGQSSSVFREKPNVDTSDYEYIINVDASHFAHAIKGIFETESGESYKVVLRINNEGAETEVIKSFRSVFEERLVAVMGSLLDVAKVKGDDALASLYQFMKDDGLEFIEFHSDIRTWPDAFAFLASET